MAEIIQTVPYNFDEIYTSLILKLGNDAPYEGSNLAILMTSMSYLVSMLNVNTSANINEMLLPLARKRENILDGARVLGYESSKSSSYRYNIEFTLTKFILESEKVLLEKYSKFTSGTNTYWYMKEDPIEIFGSIGKKYNIEVVEGELKSFLDNPGLVQYIGTELDPVTGFVVPTPYVDIPFPNIEENGIELFLSYIDNYGQQVIDEKWTKSNIFMVDTDTVFRKEFLRIDDIDFNTPRLYFKYAGIGNDVVAGSVVKANVIITSGEAGKAIAPFEFSNPAFALLGTLGTYSIIAQGTFAESTESIRRNAPKFFNTANRVITISDYEVFTNRDSRVKVSQCWGGEDEYPLRPGEIWFSFLPSNFTRSFTSNAGNIEYTLDNLVDVVNLFIEDKEIRSGDVLNPGIWDMLDHYRIPTMKLHNRNPNVLNCEFEIQILKYSNTLSQSVVNSGVFDVVNLFFKENLLINNNGTEIEYIEKFNSEFFLSSLTNRIDQYLSDSSGFNISMYNSMTIFDNNLVKESYLAQQLNLANMDLFLELRTPHEPLFAADGSLNINILPDFRTSLVASGTASVISYDFVSSPDQNKLEMIKTDIFHGTVKIGEYTIFNGSIKYIIVNLFLQDDTDARIDPANNEVNIPTGKYLVSTLRRSDFVTPQTIKVKFFSPNFRCFKNTLPRLTRVKFI